MTGKDASKEDVKNEIDHNPIEGVILIWMNSQKMKEDFYTKNLFFRLLYDMEYSVLKLLEK